MEATVPAFTKLDLPPPEEYRKRKVALISGTFVYVLLWGCGCNVEDVSDRYYRSRWFLLVRYHICQILQVY